jgi:hypothetical protein
MTERYCASCEEWTEDVLVCPMCGDPTVATAVERERDRNEDDGLTYGHPGDRLQGIE